MQDNLVLRRNAVRATLVNVPTAYRQRLRQAREAARLNLKDAASRIGVSYQALQQWEKGETRPDQDRIQDIARAYRIDARTLFFGDDDEVPSKEAPVIFREDVRQAAALLQMLDPTQVERWTQVILQSIPPQQGQSKGSGAPQKSNQKRGPRPKH